MPVTNRKIARQKSVGARVRIGRAKELPKLGANDTAAFAVTDLRVVRSAGRLPLRVVALPQGELKVLVPAWEQGSSRVEV